MRMNKGQPFLDVEADTMDAPTFSEAFLYDTVGKGDARFILGVGEEYQHLIEALGPEAVYRVLSIRPRLARRLGAGEAVIAAVRDAETLEVQQRLDRAPAEVHLDAETAYAAWSLLHEQYRTLFEPEKSMDRDQLRAYNALTDALGPDARHARERERDRLPEKLERKKEREMQLPARRALRRARRDLSEKWAADYDGRTERYEAIEPILEQIQVLEREGVR